MVLPLNDYDWDDELGDYNLTKKSLNTLHGKITDPLGDNHEL